MLLLYVVLLLLLVVAKLLVSKRVASLEKKYATVARATDELFRGPLKKPGNAGTPDPYASAKHAYLVGQAVEKRELVEGKYMGWQKTADRFTRLVASVRGWKGRVLPYALGAVDVLLVLSTLDYMGYREQISTRALLDFVTSLVTRNS
jgi:hypothetical protein